MNIENRFSSAFLEKAYQSPLACQVIGALSHGASPYLIIEQLVQQNEDMQSKIRDLLTKGIPSIIIKNDWINVAKQRPKKGVKVNVMLKDGRYTDSWLMENDCWAYNVQPVCWKPIIITTSV